MARTAQPMDAQRQSKLLTAAAKEFSKGFKDASLNTILREAGFSKSSFYHYFADKEELFHLVAATASASAAEVIEFGNPFALTKENFWESVDTTIDGFKEAIYQGSAAHWLSTVSLMEDSPTSGPSAEALTYVRGWLGDMAAAATRIGYLDTPLPPGLVGSIAENLIVTNIRWVSEHPEDSDVAWDQLKHALRCLLPEPCEDGNC